MRVRRAAVLLLALLATSSLPAKEVNVAEPVDPVRRIAAEALRSRTTWTLLEGLCRRAPHRLSGSPGAEEAVAWAKEAMEASGLENVRLEPCVVPRWERTGPARLEAGDERLSAIAIGGSVGTEEPVVAAAIEVRSLDELRERAKEAKGRVVFFDRPMDPTELDPFRAYGGAADQRVRGPAEAAKAGAVAAIVRSLTTRLDDVPHTGTLRYEDGVPRIPAVAVSTRGAERLSALLAADPETRIRLSVAARWHEDVPSHNVIGELRGREVPEEIVLVGAHLDGWDVGQGAHDDGAGCAQSIAALAILERLGMRPRRTLRAVLFMNEENGGRGGRAYAEAHAEELSRHVLALESDRGGFAPRGFETSAGETALGVLRELARPLAPLGIAFVEPGGGGADIAPMAAAGVVLAGYVPDPQRYFDFHHSDEDVLQAVNERELELGTAAIAALLHAVADRPERLPPSPKSEPR